MGVIDECHEFIAFAAGNSNAPSLVIFVKIKTDYGFVIFRGYGIAFSVTFYYLTAVFAVNHFLA